MSALRCKLFCCNNTSEQENKPAKKAKMLHNLKLKPQDTASKRKLVRATKSTENLKSPKRKKTKTPVFSGLLSSALKSKELDKSKSKKSEITSRKKQSSPEKKNTMTNSLKLNSKQRNKAVPKKLERKSVKDMNCKSLKRPVERKLLISQNIFKSVKKESLSEKLERKNVKNMNCKSLKRPVERKLVISQNIFKSAKKESSEVTTTKSKTDVKRVVPDQTSCKGRSITNGKVNRPTRKRSTNLLNNLTNCEKFGSKSQKSSTNHSNKSNATKNSKNLVKDCSLESTNKINLNNIEQTILDMQNKILKLEQKSILDEEKMNIFKMILLRQRNNDIKMLVDEKENELLLRMDLLYVNYEPERVCKLCLQLFDKKENLISLVNDQSLISLVNNTLNMQIELDNGTPTGLCDDCLQQIKRYDWMKRRSNKANIMSKKFIAIKKILNENGNPEESDFNFGTVTNDTFLLENIIDEDFSEEDQPMNSFKIEDAFSLETPSNVVVPLDLQFIKQEPQSDDEKPVLPIVPDLRMSHTKPKTVQKCRNCHTVFPYHWLLKQHHNYCYEKYKCCECNKRFFNNKLFRLHKLRRQSCVSANVFRYCVSCEVYFRWKWQLVFHVLEHEQQNDLENTYITYCFST